MDYQEVKNWLSEKENKQKIVLGFCFILVFIIGFGTGRIDDQVRKSNIPRQANYTTKATASQAPAVKTLAGDNIAATSTKPQVAGALTTASCPVRGNPASKIYHMPGGAFYNTLKFPQCFQTEGEAQAAGYRKSGR